MARTGLGCATLNTSLQLFCVWNGGYVLRIVIKSLDNAVTRHFLMYGAVPELVALARYKACGSCWFVSSGLRGLVQAQRLACLSEGGVAVYLEEIVFIAVERCRQVAGMRRATRLRKRHCYTADLAPPLHPWTHTAVTHKEPHVLYATYYFSRCKALSASIRPFKVSC